MDPLISTLVICEENKTRAELYGLWLDEYDCRTALTKREARTEFDGTTAVAIVNQSFAGGETSELLDAIRTRSPLCRVVALRNRSDAFPNLTVDHQLVKPIYPNELSEMVRTLMLRANYHLALRLYYQTTVKLSTFEMKGEQTDDETEQHERLEQRATELKTAVNALKQQMTSEDILAVRRDISFKKDVSDSDSKEKIDSKYRPTKCSQCGDQWNRSSADNEAKVTQLGAHVWRCSNCGHVQMGTDPSYQHTY